MWQNFTIKIKALLNKIDISIIVFGVNFTSKFLPVISICFY